MTRHAASPPDLCDIPAIVMCGGRGTRLREVTRDAIPKAMVRVGGRTLIDHTLDLLAGAGVRRAILAVSHHADQVQAHVGSGRDHGLDVGYYRDATTPRGFLRDLLGTCRLYGIDRGFLLAGCDEICGGLDLRAMYDFHAGRGAIVTSLAGAGVAFPDRNVDALLDPDGAVRALLRPADEPGRHGIIGISFVTDAFIRMALETPADQQHDDRAVVVRQLVPALIQQRRLFGYASTLDPYFHVGTPDVYARACYWFDSALALQPMFAGLTALI